MRSCTFVVLLSLDWTNLLASARGHLTSVWAGGWAEHVRSTIQQPWLGPGLVIAVLLLLWSGRRAQADENSDLHRLAPRRFHRPELDRFRGVRPQHHRDLEI